MRRGAFRLLPHTADIRLEVRGGSLPDLYSRSVASLYSLITDRRRVRGKERRTCAVRGDDPGSRLFLLLREALLLFSVDRFLVRGARCEVEGAGVRIWVSGEPFDASRHSLHREIKAVTAHALAVEKSRKGYLARFVVDV